MLLSSRLVLGVAAVCVQLAPGSGAAPLAIFGYVPEYRFEVLDWDAAVRSTTHLVLFSLVPTADGDFIDTSYITGALGSKSKLSAALRRAGNRAPKVLVGIGGGGGRSEHFSKLGKKQRKRLAKKVADLLQEFPVITGLDLQWDSPRSTSQWRDLGKIAKELRGSSSARLMLTMGYHPSIGAVGNFSGLRGKDSDLSFVDLFDVCHALSYSRFDDDRKHSTREMDLAAVQEWQAAGLPLERLSLGIPLFGVQRRNGESVNYGEILAKEPALVSQPDVDTSKEGVYFVGRESATQKVRFARRRGLGGVMLWELGQDARPQQAAAGLARTVQEAAIPDVSIGEQMENIGERMGISEDFMFAALTVIVGGYYTLLMLLEQVKLWRSGKALRVAPPDDEEDEDAQEGTGEQKKAGEDEGEEPSEGASELRKRAADKAKKGEK